MTTGIEERDLRRFLKGLDGRATNTQSVQTG